MNLIGISQPGQVTSDRRHISNPFSVQNNAVFDFVESARRQTRRELKRKVDLGVGIGVSVGVPVILLLCWLAGRKISSMKRDARERRRAADKKKEAKAEE